MKRYALLFSLLFAPMLAFGQNTYYADQYPGKTVGQKVTAAQKSCNAAMACIIRIEPILAGFPEGTMPAKCEKCTWLDQRTTGANWKLATLSADTIEFSPSSLSAAIASASAGGTVTATGRTSGTIATTVNINKSLHLVLDGVALTVSANPGLKVTASNVHVECKNNASITLTGANASFLAPEGTVANLTVEGCRIKGSGNDADYQAGISNASGQTLTNIKYLRNVISDVSLGIDINANLSGGINGFEISGNRIYNIVGTAPGHGYGIHHANGSGSPSSGVIANNTIERAGRHSIYQAKGSGVSITGNVIRDHRLNVGDSTGKAAIMVSRSSNVTVSANVVEHPTSGGICVDTDSGVESTNVVVQGNIVRNALDFYPVWIGTPAPATDGVTTDVTFSAGSRSCVAAPSACH
jgi:putative cofactor-binding repeat protein